MSKVLAIHRYYWPDTPPYASILRAIAREWTGAGHTVDVLTSQPSYKPEALTDTRPAVEQVDSVKVRRIAMQPDRVSRWRRVFNVAWFPLVVASRILFGRRYDVVMCSTVPPVILGWAVSLAARVRRARFVYHCMDLHPEIGRLSGEFSHPLVYWILHRMELATCRRASAIVVLSTDMREAVLARDPGLADATVVLTNFELPDFDPADHDSEPPLPANPERLRLVFTGNVGRFQGLEAITRSVLTSELDLHDLELVFMGEGAAKAELQRIVAEAPEAVRSRVAFVPHGSPSAVRALLATADLGLVSLTADVIRYAYPSKTATYLRAGLPVLVAVEPDSSLARTIQESGVGGLLPVHDAQATQAALQQWLARRAELPRMSRAARDVWASEFAAERLLPRWAALLSDVVSGPTTSEEVVG